MASDTDQPSRTPRPITVVVPTRDRAQLLAPCLVSITASIRPGDELIVVDSASTTTDVRDVAVGAGARYVRSELPGTSRARNLGWRSAAHNVIAFVDDDVRVDPGWASAIADAFDDPVIAFVTGRVNPPPSGQITGPLVAVIQEEAPMRLDGMTSQIIGHSANLAARRGALEEVGGFDELLGPGVRFRAAEDHDLFDRLFESGYIGRYEPTASSYHETWRDTGDWVRLQWAYGFGTGARIAKLARTDRPSAKRAAKVAIVQWSLKPLARALRERSLSRIAARSARLTGTVAGFAIALRYPVRDGTLHMRRRQLERGASRSAPR
jgi:glycosyltransferase involved in cell wall biosynthesis